MRSWPRVNPVSGGRFGVSARQRVGVGGLCLHEDHGIRRRPTSPPPPAVRWRCRGGGVSRKCPSFTYTGPVSVIRLELDLCDKRTRRRLERHWQAVFRLRRALQRDAADRCRAYWAAHRVRAADPTALRDRLGLTRKGIEASSKGHIEGSGWMRDHLTKAVGLHVADEVWETVDRHLFADASGRRHGPPRIGSWWDFTRIPGRARSHTKPRPVWETYRLVGTLDGHLDTFRHPHLPAGHRYRRRRCRQGGGNVGAGPARPAARPGAGPRVGRGQITMGRWRWCSPACRAGMWWHRCGCPRGGPVGASDAFPGRSRALAQDRPGAGARPARPGRLAVLRASAGTPSGISIRVNPRPGVPDPDDRRSGVDVNVSNLAVASFPEVHPEQLVVEQLSVGGRATEGRGAVAKRPGPAQGVDRSRRNTNR